MLAGGSADYSGSDDAHTASPTRAPEPIVEEEKKGALEVLGFATGQ